MLSREDTDNKTVRHESVSCELLAGAPVCPSVPQQLQGPFELGQQEIQFTYLPIEQMLNAVCDAVKMLKWTEISDISVVTY